jgi:hypothetical protein
MKKSFVVLVEYEDDDEAPMDLSHIATWVELALGSAESVKNVDVTVYHTVREAMLAMEDTPRDVVVDAKLVETGDAEGNMQVCVKLADQVPRLLFLYDKKGAKLKENEYIGATLQQIQGYHA